MRFGLRERFRSRLAMEVIWGVEMRMLQALERCLETLCKTQCLPERRKRRDEARQLTHGEGGSGIMISSPVAAFSLKPVTLSALRLVT
jgi:hypothetical protein